MLSAGSLWARSSFMFSSTVDYEDADTDQHHYDRQKYVMWGFSAHSDTLDLPANLAAESGQDKINSVIAIMDNWHPDLRRLVQITDVSTVTAFSVRTSVPIPPWPTQRVTLLGDALHNMTPFRGIGANTALRDAEALHQALVAVASGKAVLMQVLASYERDMIEYGFAAVQASLKNMKRFHAKGALAKARTKAIFRVVDCLTPLKTAFLGR